METNRTTNWTSILIGIIMILAAIIALLNPATLSLSLGIFFIVIGALKIITILLKKEPLSLDRKIQLVLGILAATIGVILLIKPDLLTNLIAYVAAIWLLLEAISSATLVGKLKSIGKPVVYIALVCALIALAAAVLLVVNPLILGLSVEKLIAIAIITIGISTILAGIAGCETPTENKKK